MVKIYECGICKKRGGERFRGIRKEVRKHLREVHHVSGTTSLKGADKKETERSLVTANTISEEVG